MPVNLLELSQNIFTKDVIANVSVRIGEGEDAIKKSVRMIVSMSLHCLSEKASTDYGAAEIIKRAKKMYSQDVLINMDVMIGEENGAFAFLIAETMGNKSGERINSIAIFYGLKPAAVTVLISLAMRVILALLGKQIANKDISPAELTVLLTLHKHNYKKDLSPGLNTGCRYVKIADYTGGVFTNNPK